MTDKIFVRDFVLPVHMGVYEHEQGVTQAVSFTIEAELVQQGGPARDDVALVPSYADFIDHVKAVVAEGHIKLTETLAERIATRCLSEPRLASVRVVVEKLERGPRAVGVEITRVRQG